MFRNEMLVKNNIEFKEEYLFEFFSGIHNWDYILRCSAPMVMCFKCISTNIMQLCRLILVPEYADIKLFEDE